ncbi:RNA polymerase sigma factor [Brassicibacter mesophilus]|uniref:RNA polymerase sigma factor n=1 Tax=Brassicibacter mesophilus TaxID=745119 RepID=UPI003D1C5677
MNEDQIVSELKNGNKAIFPYIVDLFKNRVFGMTYKFTNDYDESQDLSQEIFLKIYKEIGKFRFESKLSTWIYRISLNACLDWKRKNSKIININISSISSESKNDSSFEIRDNSPLPEDMIISNENQREVHELVYKLPDNYKSVIIMYHFNNMSYQEIAFALDIPERTVETRLYRARRMLKEEVIKLSDRSGYKWTVKKL